MNDEFMHYGVGYDDNPPGRGSGRYPKGSGENPNQHQYGFLATVAKMRKDGISNKDIAKALLGEDATTTQLRAEIAIAEKSDRKEKMKRAAELYDKYGNYSEVGRRMDLAESSVRALLDPVKAERTSRYENTAEMLKKALDEQVKNGHPGIDIGKGTELYLGCTKSTKDIAVEMLVKEGYVKTWISIPTGPDKNTNTVVLAPPGTVKSELQKDKFNIGAIKTFTPDEGKTWWTPEFPESIDSKRIFIRYKEDGGAEKDGVIELRRGVEDISLGGSMYSQVRIAVDGTNYMKGMAIYSDDIPKGFDVVYNTNKKKGTPAINPEAYYDFDEKTWKGSEVLKRMKVNETTGEIDRDNPFGALIKSPKDRDGVVTAGGQRKYIGEDGKEHLSVINKLQDEGDWDSWSRNLSSQFLSKQPLKLINQQIDLTLANKKNELEEIMNLTNPAIKKKMLEDYANSCDHNASELSVQGFKKQAFQVILPITDLKDNEIYAPNFKDGDTVALVRYPHGGTFEIPILKVNNRQETAKKVMENASDAVGINSKVAEKLSGADFDGDTALVIPMASNNISIKATETLFENYDPKALYKLPDSAPEMKNKTKQRQMGEVTNLITDMTVGGADFDQIEKAVKHSMVVIDAQKHHLDYKQSARDNDIRELKKEWQERIDPFTGKPSTGASTILSRAGSEARTDTRKEVTDVNKMTPEERKKWDAGGRVWRSKNEKKKIRIEDPDDMTDEELELFKAGKKIYREGTENRQIKVTQMDLVDDAMDLVRDKNNPKEVAYANYANELKALANQARKESRAIAPYKVSKAAAETYREEIDDLKAQLRIAEMNAPKERQAQAIANKISSAKFQDNPGMDFEHKQREKARSLIEARAIVGAKKEQVKISDRAWEAIQAQGISFSTLQKILLNTDQEKFKKLATPKQTGSLTKTQINLIKSMLASGMYTQRDMADALGVSTSVVSKAIREIRQ